MDFYKIKLNDFDALRLREAMEKKRFLVSLKDSELFSKDLGTIDKNNFYPAYLSKDGKFSYISKILGTFSESDYGLDTGRSLTEYVKMPETKQPGTYKFTLGLSSDFFVDWPGLSFFILKTDSRILKFMGGIFYEKKNAFNKANTPIIDRAASYFHNRIPLYEQVHNMLKSNAEEFITRTSKDFFEDLSLLFSAENSSEEIPDFYVDKNNIFEYPIWERYRDANNPLIGWTTCFVRSENREAGELSKLQISIRLNNKNELLFAADEDNYYASTTSDDVYKKYVDIVLYRTNDFLKQFVSSVNFGSNIYQKLKSKLFLASILDNVG